ncbi:reverse transcriptase domain-containing protein [Tanacetum coccineum]
MRTRNSYFPNNSNVTIPRRQNKGRAPNIVKPELHTIVAPMAERTMEELLLRAPTEVSKGLPSTLRFRNVPNDVIKLMMFPYSLEGASKTCYEKEPPNSIMNWEDLVTKFVNQFFPPSKTTHLKNEISRFTQKFEETFSEAWERFKELLRACLHQGFTKLNQVDTFYNGLNENEQDSLNAMAGGNLLNQTTRYSSTNDKLVNRIDIIDAICEEYAPELLGFSNSSGDNPTPTSESFTSEFILEEIEAYLKDDSISPEIDHADCDPEEDICLIEKLLNNDPFQLPPMDLKQSEVTEAKSSIEEPPELELKDLPSHLEYAFLEENDKLPVIIANCLKNDEKDALLKVLKSHKRAIAWKITDIKGIDPRFCTHKILMEDDYKPTVQSQRRVNPKIHEVIKKEVLKLVDAGMIYPISDSPWVSPVHCVPKKGGITVVANEENELIPTRLVTGWRVCIDYRKLNEATQKDHFPLPFMDQMIERLAGNEFYCFLDGFSGYFQIPIDPQDQEKTTFTCPYGTFAYRRMPFGLCNAPGTFQRCMMAIFHDMIEKTMKCLMDDFWFGDSFDCVSNLEKMLKRCEDTNLVLNWEKCHFMCREGIVLGHKISKSGIEVDRAKVDVIAKLPHPTTVKGVRSFLGHAGFYQRFIQWYFSKIADQ